MRQKSIHPESPSERIVKSISRATRKRHSSEEKIRIVLDGMRGGSSIAELCRHEGIAESLYYAWSKACLEAGKKRLAGDTAHRLLFGRKKLATTIWNKGSSGGKVALLTLTEPKTSIAREKLYVELSFSVTIKAV